MGFTPFFDNNGTTLEKIFRIVCLCIWAIGGIIFIYNTWEAVQWNIIFPKPNVLHTAIWFMRESLHFACLWLPMGFLLIYWRIKNFAVCIGYLVGTVITILFSVIAFCLVLMYDKNPDLLRDEYLNHVKEEMKYGFPPTVKQMLKAEKCCSWYGPVDFGTVFNMSDKVDRDLTFMTEVARCNGDVFIVKKGAHGNLEYAPASPSKTEYDIPTACGMIYKTSANRMCNYIVFMSTIVVVATVVCGSLYMLNYIKMGKGIVSPAPAPGPGPWTAPPSQYSLGGGGGSSTEARPEEGDDSK